MELEAQVGGWRGFRGFPGSRGDSETMQLPPLPSPEIVPGPTPLANMPRDEIPHDGPSPHPLIPSLRLN